MCLLSLRARTTRRVGPPRAPPSRIGGPLGTLINLLNREQLTIIISLEPILRLFNYPPLISFLISPPNAPFLLHIHVFGLIPSTDTTVVALAFPPTDPEQQQQQLLLQQRLLQHQQQRRRLPHPVHPSLRGAQLGGAPQPILSIQQGAPAGTHVIDTSRGVPMRVASGGPWVPTRRGTTAGPPGGPTGPMRAQGAMRLHGPQGPQRPQGAQGPRGPFPYSTQGAPSRGRRVYDERHGGLTMQERIEHYVQIDPNILALLCSRYR